jgi:hypothetical protein
MQLEAVHFSVHAKLCFRPKGILTEGDDDRLLGLADDSRSGRLRPIGASFVEVLRFHLTTVFGLIPWRRASDESLAFDDPGDLFAGGINARSGQYLAPALTPAVLSAIAEGRELPTDKELEIKRRREVGAETLCIAAGGSSPSEVNLGSDRQPAQP